jgi:hypothetical protein
MIDLDFLRNTPEIQKCFGLIDDTANLKPKNELMS